MIYSNILEELNEKQKQAVESPRKPLLVIAGPGTGKTRTLIARIVYEIQHYQIPPDQIRALTFSNKAAGEMKQRLLHALNDQAEKVKISTFHSFCLNVLRKYHQLAGLAKTFSVCDDQYQMRLLQELLANRIRENVERKARGIQLAFSNHLLKNKPLPAFSASVFDEYTRHLQKYQLLDYNLLLVKTLELLQNHPDVLEQYRFLNQSVLVDEFQDTDPVQYQIVKLLAWKHRNIFVVADDDQSIYAWRGANPENIRRYMDDFSISEPIFLEINYRSGKNIVEAAQHVVRSTDRIGPDKKLHGNDEKDSLIRAYFFKDENQEIRYITKKITDWQANEEIPYSEMAIIYPQHRFGERLSSYLLKERIPFQMASGKNLSEHPLMQKIILYLKLIRMPSDTLALEQLVEKELGYQIYKQVQNFKNLHNTTFRKALNELSQREEISYKIRNQISTFIGHIANMVNLKSFFSFERLISEIIRGSQEISRSVLRHNAAKLSRFECRYFKKIARPETSIWVYHQDERISFIALRLLKAAFGERVHRLSAERTLHVKSSDIALLLDPLPVENLSCRYELMFKQTTDRRRSVLSVLFRWLQAHLQREDQPVFDDYVIFDLETTGKNPETCGVVEIAAVRVKEGEIIDEFQTLVNPGMEIEEEAREVHHISTEDIAQAPSEKEAWEQFKAFAGNSLLIAHNGYGFDFRVLDRLAKDFNQPRLSNVRYDTLILARTLFPNQQNSIDGLAARFKLDAGTRHRALDDVKVLQEIFVRLLDILGEQDVKISGEEFTEYIALGNVLLNELSAVEDKIFFSAGIQKLLSPYSRIRSAYAAQFGIEEDELLNNLKRIASRQTAVSVLYKNEDDFALRIMQTAKEFNEMPVDEAIAEFLSFVALVNPQDSLEPVDAVSMLTYHAAKGLEFDRVIIVGMEDENMPSFFAYKNDDEDDRTVTKKLEEQKRLLYVGITRAKSEVILTAVKNRFGRLQKASPFLNEIKESIEIKTYQ
ncbi:MAG TPA: hypothetical protein ENK44_00215 [Caldithrix abyssi]|uniref:DNA 3'-5' helicase n=1 Tax=Caldithrix abyssi TaxID=187145 RepID=A0A7V4TZH6_CALAY|nr:hypothetical protein [Caldithrix abyssi]